MEALTYENIEQLLRGGEISFWNVYNSDISLQSYYASQYYKNYNYDTIETPQEISVVFFDIEVFTNGESIDEVKDAKHPINCISLSHNKTKLIRSFYLLLDKNYEKFGVSTKDNFDYESFIKDRNSYYKQELINNGYGEYDIDIELFTNELELSKRFWSVVHEYDPATISGYNSDRFDIPYLYYRLSNLLGSKVAADRVISKFGIVKNKDEFVTIPDFVNTDILHLYKPRSEQGLNLGELQPQYTLDFVAEQELGLKKLAYKDENITLDQFYLNDPIQYLLYNIIDVVLTRKLNEKLKHIELYNSIRRIMKTPMSISMAGSSPLFDTYVFSKLDEKEKYVRYGINNESSKTINPEQIEKFPIPKGSKWKIKPIKIPSKVFQETTTKYPGAYVKTPIPAIVNDDSLIIDLDASLPPWERIFVRRNGFTFWNFIGDYNFEEGDETLTWNKNNETCWRKIKGKIEHDWDGELTTITTETGKVLTTTSNHSVFGIQKGTKIDTPYIIDAGNLKIGDNVVGFKHFETDGLLTSIMPELIGFWLSDGWTSSIYGSYYIAKQDKTILEQFQPYIGNIRKKREASDKYKEEWVGKVEEPIRTQLKDFYIATTRKDFQYILNYNLENRLKIWEGMFEADGTLHGLNQTDVVTPTERLCKYRIDECVECFIVAHTIGWRPKLRSNGVDNTPVRPGDNSCHYGPDLVIPEVYQSHRGYTRALGQLKLSGNHRHPLYKIGSLLPYVYNSYSNDIGLEKITNIEKQHYAGKVYDLSVEETERFFAGTGIGAHNSSLYPSCILMSNISFDSYEARILPPTTYKILKLLESVAGKTQYPQEINASIFDIVCKYVDKIESPNKGQIITSNYYIFMYLFDAICRSGLTFDKLLNPTNTAEEIILKTYLIPLLDIINTINPSNQKYNQFAYDYIFSSEEELTKKYNEIYIIKNIRRSDSYIEKMSLSDAISFIKKYSLTLAGTLFLKHEEYTGLFAEFLKLMGGMRKSYKKLRDDSIKGSDEYKLNDSRQSSFKVIMNTTYGLFGLSNFRYSNHWLAQSITNQGMLTLKIAWHLTEEHLRFKYGGRNV